MMKISYLLSTILSVMVYSSCSYRYVGVTPKFSSIKREEIDSLILFRPLIEPKIDWYDKRMNPGWLENERQQVGEENAKCLTNAVIDYWESKVEPVEFSEDFKLQTIDLFNRLSRRNIDLNDSIPNFSPPIPKNSKIRYSLIVRFHPTNRYSISVGKWSAGKYNAEEICAQLIIYDNLRKRIKGYDASCKEYTEYKVKIRRCDKFIDLIMKDLFPKAKLIRS